MSRAGHCLGLESDTPALGSRKASRGFDPFRFVMGLSNTPARGKTACLRLAAGEGTPCAL